MNINTYMNTNNLLLSDCSYLIVFDLMIIIYRLHLISGLAPYKQDSC